MIRGDVINIKSCKAKRFAIYVPMIVVLASFSMQYLIRIFKKGGRENGGIKI